MTIILSILFAFISLEILAQELPKTSIVIIGQIEGIKDDESFSIMESDGESGSLHFHKALPDDNGIIKKGRFTLINVYHRKDVGRFLLIPPGQTDDSGLVFYANPGDTVYVNGKGDIACLWSVNSKASEQKDWRVIQQATLAEEQAYQKAIKDHHNYRMYRRDTEMDETEWERTGELLKQKAAQMDSLKHLLQIAQLETMKTLPVNNVWMQTLLIMSRSYIAPKVKEKVRELYNLRMDEINRKPDGKRISAMLYPYPIAKLGDPIVDGEMMDLKGNTHRLSDFKGKYVVIDFWSTNCGPCMAAIPDIEKFVKRNPSVEVISLCLNQYESWRTHPSYQNLPWHNMNDGGGWMGLAKSYNVHAVPTYVLISPEGTYIQQWVGQEIFEEEGTLEKFISQHRTNP